MLESTLKQLLPQPLTEVPELRVKITTKGWQRFRALQTAGLASVAQVKLNIHFVLKTKTNSAKVSSSSPTHLASFLNPIALFFVGVPFTPFHT